METLFKASTSLFLAILEKQTCLFSELLCGPGKHDDDIGLLLKDHLPEVLDTGLQRSLQILSMFKSLKHSGPESFE